MTALLSIGTSTNRVNLLDPDGFLLYDWIPAALNHLGTWQSSPFGDGRRQVDYRNENVVDTFELKLKHVSQDGAIRATQKLRQILRAAINYWKPPDIWTVIPPTYATDPTPGPSPGTAKAIPVAPEPIYLMARGPKETNTRYAVVYDGRLPADDNPYAQPFASASCETAILDDLALIVEHGPWTANAPGSSACIQTSGTRNYRPAAQLTWSGSPTAQNDDGWVQVGELSANLASTRFVIAQNPLTSSPTIAGVRFPSVNVPQAATVIKAYIAFEASDTDSNCDTRAIIYGNDVDDAAQFADGADLYTRALTQESVHWPIFADGNTCIEPWTAGNTYNTPDLAPIVQEILDRDDWVSGNAMAFMIHDNNSDVPGGRRADSFDGAPTAPVLYIDYVTTDYEFGRSATCENETYSANKDNMANITHVYRHDSVLGWSGNLLGTYDYNLFVAAPGNGSAVYFGCTVSVDNSGPFCSLVFDLSSALVYAGSASMAWEYWNGGAWTALNEQDNTSDGSGPLSNEGVYSVNWTPDSSWANETLLNAVGVGAPNIDGFWVRAVATIGGGDSITGPATQANRDVYTITWSHIDIDADEVAGDLAALARIRIEGVGAGAEGYFPYAERSVDRIFVGLRSTNRGADFRQFLNFSDEQNVVGVYPHVGDDAAWVTDTSTPTGRILRYTPTGTTELTCGYLELFPWIAPQYYGSYRAFVRVDHTVSGAEEFAVRLRWRTGLSGFEQESDQITVTDSGRFFVVDIGRVSLPPTPLLAGSESLDTILFAVSVQASVASGTLDILDLVLVPADEWIGEFEAPPDPHSRSVRNMGWNRILDVDSLGNPKRAIRAPLVVVSDGYIASQWICRTTGPCILHPRTGQRLHVFCTKLDDSEPEAANRYQVFTNDRYFSMRGNL